MSKIIDPGIKADVFAPNQDYSTLGVVVRANVGLPCHVLAGLASLAAIDVKFSA